MRCNARSAALQAFFALPLCSTPAEAGTPAPETTATVDMPRPEREVLSYDHDVSMR